MKKSILVITITLAIGLAAIAQSGDPLPYTSLGKTLLTGTAPVAGTSEVQTLTLSDTTAGTYRVTFAGRTSGLVTVTGTDANAAIGTKFQTAVGAIPTIGGTANCVITTGTAVPVVMTLTYGSNLAKLNVAQVAATVVSGTCTLVPATVTPGVTADGRTAGTGQLLIDKSTGILYSNTSTTALQPAWGKVSAQ